MIQNEVITSHKKNVDIDWRWQDLEEKEDCEELAKVPTSIYNRLLSLGHRFSKGRLHYYHNPEGRLDQTVLRATQEQG